MKKYIGKLLVFIFAISMTCCFYVNKVEAASKAIGMNISKWVLDEGNSCIYAVSGDSKKVLFINIGTLQVESYIELDSEPTDIKFANGRLYVSLDTNKQIVIINAQTKCIEKTITTAYDPYTVAIDGNKLFYTQRDQWCKLCVYNLASEEEQTIGDKSCGYYEPDITVDEENHTLYIGESGCGSLTKLRTTDYAKVGQTAPLDDYLTYYFSDPNRKVLFDRKNVYYSGYAINPENLEIVDGNYNDHIVYVKGNYVFSNTAIYSREKYLKISNLPANSSQILMDSLDNVYLFDSSNNTIRKDNINLNLDESINYEKRTDAIKLQNCSITDWVYDSSNSFIYAVSMEKNMLMYINANTMTIEGEKYVGSMPSDIELYNGNIYIALRGATKVAITDTSLSGAVDAITLKSIPYKIAIDDGKLFYVGEDQKCYLYIHNLNDSSETVLKQNGFYYPDILIDRVNHILYVGEYFGTDCKIYSMSTSNYSMISESSESCSPSERRIAFDGTDVFYAGCRFNSSDLTQKYGDYHQPVILADGDYILTSNGVFDRESFKKSIDLPFNLTFALKGDKDSAYLYVDRDKSVYKIETIEQKLKNIEISGSNKITIPWSGNSSQTYTAVPKNQYGGEMTGTAVIWSIDETVSGANIDPSSGIVTVERTAQPGSITVRATAGAITNTYTVQLVRAQPFLTSLDITGPNNGIIPPEGSAALTYTSVIKDQYGIEMVGEAVTWFIPDTVAGVCINRSSGIVTVDSSAQPSSFTVGALSGSIADTYTVQLVRAESVVTSVDIIGLGHVTIPPEGSTVTTYNAIVKDQYKTKMNGQTVSWSLSNAVAGVNIDTNTGAVTVDDTAQPGTFTVIAESGDVTVTWAILLIRDLSVATTIKINGAESITVPSSATVISAYSAEVKDQYKLVMAGQKIIWSLDGPVTGVSIDGNLGVVTVYNTAQSGMFKIKAVSGTITNTFTVELLRASSFVSSIEVSGAGSITIPPNGGTTSQYSAIVKDQYGLIMINKSIVWLLDEPVAGVSINSTSGVVTINNSAQTGWFKVKALLGTVANTYRVGLVKAASVVSSIEVSGASKITIPSRGTTTAAYSAVAKDQYGVVMTNQTAVWSLAAPMTGVSINSSSGVVNVDSTAKPGSITIKAGVGGISSLYVVTLNTSPKSIRANSTSITVARGESESLPTITGTFKDGSRQDVTDCCSWNSKNPSIAVVENGKVKGIAVGSATLEALVGSIKATVRVTVLPVCTEITADKGNLSVEVGSSTSIKLTAIYENGKTETITTKAQWISANSSVADANKGKIIGKAKGMTTITATYCGKNIDIPVAVTPVITKIEAESTKIDAEVGDKIPAVKITAYYIGADCENISDKCSWSSSNSGVASVNENGTITPNSKGSATINALYRLGGKTKKVSIKVKVTPKILSLTIESNFSRIDTGKTAKVKAILNYNDGSTSIVTTKVTWISSNTDIATVQNGTIKGIGKGDVTIIAIYNGNYSKSFNLSVIPVLKSLKANVSTVTLSLGSISECTAVANYQGDDPKDVTDECVWTSSNTNIAIVENGVITPITKGSATISAAFGNKKTTIRLKVID